MRKLINYDNQQFCFLGFPFDGCLSCCFFWLGGGRAAANGANLRQTLKAAAIGALSAAAFYGVSKLIPSSPTASANAIRVGKGMWMSTTNFAKLVVAQGMVGGAMSVLQGGKFGHGFVSAGVAKLANVNGMYGTQQGIGHTIARVAMAAIIGGTVSEATGGKFANGARTAALAQLFNGEGEARRDPGKVGIFGKKGGDGEFGDSSGDKATFMKKLDALNTTVDSMDSFGSKDGALNWLHKNAHSLAVEYDFEITANVFSDGIYWRVGSLGAIPHAHTFDVFSSKSPGQGWGWKANWHSHADGAGSGFSGQDRSLYARMQNTYPNLTYHVSFINWDDQHELKTY
ncbi:MAG: hypothetical protein U5M23_01960 [Marinagarivorans sp.]|nr:hypothetical protein [Marinagarivorans sp.]